MRDLLDEVRDLVTFRKREERNICFDIGDLYDTAAFWLRRLLTGVNPSLLGQPLDFESPRLTDSRSLLSTVCVWIIEDTLRDLSQHAKASLVPEFKVRNRSDIPLHPQLLNTFIRLTEPYAKFDHATSCEYASDLQHIITMEFIRTVALVAPYLDDYDKCEIIEICPNFTIPFVVIVKVLHDVSVLRTRTPSDPISTFSPRLTGL